MDKLQLFKFDASHLTSVWAYKLHTPFPGCSLPVGAYIEPTPEQHAELGCSHIYWLWNKVDGKWEGPFPVPEDQVFDFAEWDDLFAPIHLSTFRTHFVRRGNSPTWGAAVNLATGSTSVNYSPYCFFTENSYLDEVICVGNNKEEVQQGLELFMEYFNFVYIPNIIEYA